ncbi:hypothetical protein [Faecalibacterium prausnitzii]|jgi:hypothetical protein|uniref:hypothetical protein n=1 Tax=Faecalibacterium prausnitzii TaxID=853 RepID=UPI001FA94FF0|nr:hypothetical protein [Faecalibacterium prausnitzii]
MKLWKRWTAAALAAAMALLLLAACGPSGPSAPDAPDKPGSSETGKDPTDKKTEAQKVAAVVEALNTVRKNNGNNTPLTMDAEVCAMAEKMAKLQLDSLLGVYGSDPMTSKQYSKDWNDISKLTVKGKKLVGVGGYGAYPTESDIRDWVKDTRKWKPALVTSTEATLVGVGVVHNTDLATKDRYPIMVVVMTY